MSRLPARSVRLFECHRHSLTPFAENDIFFRNFNIWQIKVSMKTVTDSCLFVCIVLFEFHNHIILSYFPQKYRMRTLLRA